MTVHLATAEALARKAAAENATGEQWLTVQQASKLIGVSPATLRRWSAAGQVPAFTTPGGHRRFARSIILGLLPTDHGTQTPLQRLGQRPTELAARFGGDLATDWFGAAWATRLTGIQSAALRDYGRSIVQSLVATLEAPTPTARAQHAGDAAAAAGEAGRVLALADVELGELMATLQLSRQRWFDGLADLCRARGLDGDESVDLLATVTMVGDRLQAAFVAGHRADSRRSAQERP